MVKPSDSNEELRYSLRSLANLHHNKVYFVGHQPNWTQNVIHIPRVQGPHSKYVNTVRNMRLACTNTDISDNFILMNDDFFIMHRIEEIPTLHRGKIPEVVRYYENLGGLPYAKSMRETENVLKSLGISDPLSYELHTPMVINRERYQEIMDSIPQIGANFYRLNKRTLYGNLAKVGGKKTYDVKITTDSAPNRDQIFISTVERSFDNYKVGEYLREVFNQPSCYER